MVRKTCCCLDTVYKRVLRLLYRVACALGFRMRNDVLSPGTVLSPETVLSPRVTSPCGHYTSPHPPPTRRRGWRVHPTTARHLGLASRASRAPGYTHGARCTIASPTVQLCSRAPSPRCERHLLHRAAPCTTVQADFPASAPSVREGCTESWHRRCRVSISVACRASSHIFSCTSNRYFL